MAEDRFYDMSEAVMTKASPEAICPGGGLVVSGLLPSIGINNNKIIYGIPNCIPSPSKLWYVAKKYHKATFMRIAGFV